MAIILCIAVAISLLINAPLYSVFIRERKDVFSLFHLVPIEIALFLSVKNKIARAELYIDDGDNSSKFVCFPDFKHIESTLKVLSMIPYEESGY